MTHNTKYRYSLDKSSKKYHCPACNKKTLVVYIENETNSILNKSCGKCDRIQKCNYHSPPSNFDDGKEHKTREHKPPKPEPPKRVSLLDYSFVNRSMNNYRENNFACYLMTMMGEHKAMDLLRRFKVGTSRKRKGFTIFWQIDFLNNVRSGKLINYDLLTGKRVKTKSPALWVHTEMGLKSKGFNLVQCFFGEHQLRIQSEKNKPVAIVESEKTAIMMTAAQPAYIWLSCGSAGNFYNSEKEVRQAKWVPLQGRKVVAFPDVGMFEHWEKKAAKIKKEFSIDLKVSDILERSEKSKDMKGADLADFFTVEKKSKGETPKPLIEQEQQLPILPMKPTYHIPTVSDFQQEIIENLWS